MISRTCGPRDLIAFARRFGELDEHDQPQYCLAGYPEIALVSNVKEGDRYVGAPKAGRQWHSDAQYLRTSSVSLAAVGPGSAAQRG